MTTDVTRDAFPTLAWTDVPKVGAPQMQQAVSLATGKFGLDARVLVEHTGRNLVELAEAHAPEGPVLVVAGRGENGSGGLAAARLLGLRGRRVWVVPTHEADNYSGTPREQLELLKHVPSVRVKTSLPKMKFSVVIDAAIGTSLEGPPRGRTLDVITVLNAMDGGCTLISVDVPTGVSVPDGDVPGEAVRPTMTLAVALPKGGVEPGGVGGRVFVGDLGFPPGVYEALGLEPVTWPSFVTELVD
ncbi:MAG: NAD(P)H-hydrate epimerase [Trueperaceae bacterium]|nr:NAD(P)H-hydrate epimerase [Trueperaceae bacterium]